MKYQFHLLKHKPLLLSNIIQSKCKLFGNANYFYYQIQIKSKKRYLLCIKINMIATGHHTLDIIC